MEADHCCQRCVLVAQRLGWHALEDFLDPAFSLDPKLKRLRKLSALLVDESSTGLYLGFYKSSIWFVSGLKGPRRER